MRKTDINTSFIAMQAGQVITGYYGVIPDKSL